MGLTRRHFCKSLLAGMFLVPLAKKDKYAHFDPAKEYGGYMYYNSSDFSQSRKLIEEQAKATIPEQYRDKIDYSWYTNKYILPEKYNSTMMWKYYPKVA